MKKKVNEILKLQHTGKSMKTIEKDTDRDNFLNANEAGITALLMIFLQ